MSNSRTETNRKVKMGLGSKRAKSQNGPRVKMGQGSKRAKRQNGPRVKMGQGSRGATLVYPSPSPERVKTTVNSKKETNGRVKIGYDGLQWLKSAIKTIESEWAKWSHLGPGPSWARSNLTRIETGSRSQYGSEQLQLEQWLMRVICSWLKHLPDDPKMIMTS